MKRVKKLFSILIILLISLLLVGCAKKEEEKVEKPKVIETNLFSEDYEVYKPELWVVEKNNNKVYLFGTIHIGREDMYPLPDTVMNAYNESKVLAVESDVLALEEDYELLMSAMKTMFYIDGTTIKDILTEEELTELKELAKKYKITVRDKDVYKPMFYYSSIQQQHIELL